MSLVVLYSEVAPQDRSPTLPRGTYEVKDLKFIHHTLFKPWNEDDESGFGLATFVVVEGQHAGPKRRIGCVVPEERAAERLVVMLGYDIEAFERAAKESVTRVLVQAKEIFDAEPPDHRTAFGSAFIKRYLAERKEGEQ